jgi:hypothetical protein
MQKPEENLWLFLSTILVRFYPRSERNIKGKRSKYLGVGDLAKKKLIFLKIIFINDLLQKKFPLIHRFQPRHNIFYESNQLRINIT